MSPESSDAETNELKTVSAKTGDRVLFVDGKATASLVDPQREAQGWLESVKPLLPKRPETLVVIGIGSGFHLKALREAAPEFPIVALDTCSHSVEFVSTLGLRDCKAVYISGDEIARGAGAVLAKAGVTDWILEPFTLIRHRATMARSRQLLRVEAWLLGRSAEGLRAHLALRPSLAAILNPEKLRDVTEIKLKTVDVFSIRDFVACGDIKSEPSQERRLLRVLEELVR